MGQLYGARHSTPAQARDPGGPRDPSRTGPDRRQFDAMAECSEDLETIWDLTHRGSAGQHRLLAHNALRL